MLASRSICPVKSPHSFVILIKKQDDSWHMCVDYRGLNQITIKDKFPIHVIDELLDKLNEAQFVSKLAPDIVKFECTLKMWRKLHSEATMNFW